MVKRGFGLNMGTVKVLAGLGVTASAVLGLLFWLGFISEAMNVWLLTGLAVLGLVAGFMNIQKKERVGVLVSGLTLLTVSSGLAFLPQITGLLDAIGLYFFSFLAPLVTVVAVMGIIDPTRK